VTRKTEEQEMSLRVPDTAFIESAVDLLSKTHLEVLQVQEVKICGLLKNFGTKIQQEISVKSRNVHSLCTWLVSLSNSSSLVPWT